MIDQRSVSQAQAHSVHRTYYSLSVHCTVSCKVTRLDVKKSRPLHTRYARASSSVSQDPSIRPRPAGEGCGLLLLLLLLLPMSTVIDVGQTADEREAATHGCCCKRCTVTSEIWACFLIDLSSVLGLLVEVPRWSVVPASLHAVDMFRGYLVFSAFSACLILYALRAGKQEAWPRRALVRFMSLKLPIFIIFCMGYFTVSPWAAPLAQWVCEHDFESMRTVTGGDNQTCVQWFPWLCTMNNAIYIPAYAAPPL